MEKNLVVNNGIANSNLNSNNSNNVKGDDSMVKNSVVNNGVVNSNLNNSNQGDGTMVNNTIIKEASIYDFEDVQNCTFKNVITPVGADPEKVVHYKSLAEENYNNYTSIIAKLTNFINKTNDIKAIIINGEKTNISFENNKEAVANVVAHLLTEEGQIMLGIYPHAPNNFSSFIVDGILYVDIQICMPTLKKDKKKNKKELKEIADKYALERAKAVADKDWTKAYNLKISETKEVISIAKEENKRKREIKSFSVTKQAMETKLANNLKPDLDSKEKFMSYCASVHGTFSQNNTNKSVGAQTTAIDSFSNMLFIENDELFVTIAIKALNSCESIANTYGDIRELGGEEDYVPVVHYKGQLHGTAFELVPISESIELNIFGQLPKIKLNAKNLRALVRDLNDVGRMYQELTIDAAKRLYIVSALFFQEIVRAESTVHFTYSVNSFKKMKENPFKLSRGSYGKYDLDSEMNVGEFKEIYDDFGNLIKIIYRDNLGDIQETEKLNIENFAKELIVSWEDTCFSTETVKKWGLTTGRGRIIMDCYEYIVKPYNKMVHKRMDYLEQLRNDKDISYFQRLELEKALDDQARIDNKLLSQRAYWFFDGMDIVEAGLILTAASHIKINRVDTIPEYDASKTNSCYLHVAPELGYAYMVSCEDADKLCGFPLEGDIENINEGDAIEFVNGNAVNFDNVWVDDSYNGILIARMIDGRLVAAIKILDLLEHNRVAAPKMEELLFDIHLQTGSFIDSKEYCLNNEYRKIHWGKGEDFDTQAAVDAQGALRKAETLTLLPRWEHVDNNGDAWKKSNVILAHVAAKDGNSYFDIPVCKYVCYSDYLQKKIAGLVFTKPVKTNYIDGKHSAWIEFQALDKIDVELPEGKDNIEDSIDASSYEFSNPFAKKYEEQYEASWVQDAFDKSDIKGGQDEFDFSESFESAL